MPKKPTSADKLAQTRYLLFNNLVNTAALIRLQVETLKRLAAKGVLTGEDASLIFDVARVDLIPDLPGVDMPEIGEELLKRLTEYEREVTQAASAARRIAS